jgi:hypothetical protein
VPSTKPRHPRGFSFARNPKSSRSARRLHSSLKVDGIQCNSYTLGAGDFCYTHQHHRHPQCPKKGSKIVMPLLEDHSAIQLVLSQLAHGIFSGELDNASARTLAYVCQVAAFTLPRPAAARAKSDAASAPIQEPVAEVVTTPDGEHLGPIEKYQGPTGTFAPQWSFSKFLYDRHCEELGETKPTSAADYPASGWLTEEEMKEDPQDWIKRTNAHKAELYKVDQARKAKETAAALAAGLPDPHLKRQNPDCPYDVIWCDGPNHRHHCFRCGNDILIAAGLPPVDLDKIAARIAADKLAATSATTPTDKPSTEATPITEGQPIGDLKACASDARSTRPIPLLSSSITSTTPAVSNSCRKPIPRGGRCHQLTLRNLSALAKTRG